MPGPSFQRKSIVQSQHPALTSQHQGLSRSYVDPSAPILRGCLGRRAPSTFINQSNFNPRIGSRIPHALFMSSAHTYWISNPDIPRWWLKNRSGRATKGSTASVGRAKEGGGRCVFPSSSSIQTSFDSGLSVCRRRLDRIARPILASRAADDVVAKV